MLRPRALTALLILVLACLQARAGEIRLPAYRLLSPSGVESTLVGSAHAGFTLEGEVVLQLLARLRGARRVYFEGLPWTSEYLLEARRQAARFPASDILKAYYLSLANDLPDTPRFAGVRAMLADGGLPPVLMNAVLLGLCGGGMPATRSIDEELNLALSGIPQGVLEPPEAFFSMAASEVGDAEWMGYFERVRMFVLRPGCGRELAHVLTRISRYLSLGLATELVDTYRTAHLSLLGTSLMVDLELSAARHHYLTARIADVARDEGVAIIIGAAHLEGPDGVVARLARSGFVVQKLPD